MKPYHYFTEAQLKAEVDKCLYCAEKPCREACPAHCSPADFIMAAREGRPSDLGRAAEEILKSNPLGEVCGVVCPDSFCMDACSKKVFDRPLDIPRIQATVVRRARELGVLRDPEKAAALNGKRIAIVGAGPAGLGGASLLARRGYVVDIYDSAIDAGGSAALIPEPRLPRKALSDDLDFVMKLGSVRTFFGKKIEKPADLLKNGYDAVLVAAGEMISTRLGVPGEDLAISSLDYLKQPEAFQTSGMVAVVGGGAVAADCAVTAKRLGARSVEMFVRRGNADMRLTPFEREMLIENGVDISARTRILAIDGLSAKAIKGAAMHREKTNPALVPKSLKVTKLEVAQGKSGDRPRLVDIPGTASVRPGFALVILAIGSSAEKYRVPSKNVFYAGDFAHGASTVVEAVASGKNAAAELDLVLSKATKRELKAFEKLRAPAVRSKAKSRVRLEGVHRRPVDLSTDFFGIRIASPFLLSAAPATDGLEQMVKAYEHGWAGGVMKTAFDGLPIHIPNNYMVTFNPLTFGNCDNVSGHALDRVCREIRKLRKLYPDRLTMGSTGGPVTGKDARDAKVWQANTRKLEKAGAIGVEYSLSCPQGGDGTEGNIVSQSAAATAKVIDWVMQESDPSIPKLFKLTSAVTSVKPILKAVSEVLARYPGKKAGVTLANSFPVMAFRSKVAGARWDEGVVVGMSGEGVAPISYLALADAASFGLHISGNGGVMDYRAAANFLALGARTVQVCTVVMKYGLGVIDELDDGLSHFLYREGIGSVRDLIGRALPNAITPFNDLTAVKQLSEVDRALCEHCGNCTHCGYGAIHLDKNRIPVIDPAKCIGCTICAKNCFAGALHMRDRTPGELKVLKED